jgi:hypothetical protein
MAIPARLDVHSRAERVPVCESKAQCDTAWNEAIEWVSQRCAFPIKTQTETLVETEGPLGAPSTALACRLERVAGHDSGTEQLELNASCGNWFDCTPELVYFQAAFNDQMRSAIDELSESAGTTHE